MTSHLRRMIAWILAVLILLPLLISAVSATETEEDTQPQATDISKTKYITKCVGFPNYGYFFDGQILYGGKSTAKDSYFTVSHPDGVGSVYIIFEYEYGPIQVTNNDTGEVRTLGKGAHLHEFLDMEKAFGIAPSSVTLKFISGTAHINEVSLFTPGQVPDSVQQWDNPVNQETDLVLFSAHGDDEHLFFAGILPYYGVERDYQVQVVYLTDHRGNGNQRMHEMLDGLWSIGLTTYPVFGDYEDFKTVDLESAMKTYRRNGWSEEHMIGFVVEQLRRFKPKVVVAHDFDGEYGHSQHMAYAYLVSKALEVSMDPEQYPELAEKYGTWDVPKAYFHLYPENPIVMDWDQPLASYDGQTAFEVSVYTGFQQHKSQIKDYSWYYRGCDTAAQIPEYSPCEYGLYRTTVGQDVLKNDFFENIPGYEMPNVQETEPLEQAQTEPEQATSPLPQESTPDETPDPIAQKDRLICTVLISITGILTFATVIVLFFHKKSAKILK